VDAEPVEENLHGAGAPAGIPARVLRGEAHPGPTSSSVENLAACARELPDDVVARLEVAAGPAPRALTGESA
jgi:hypothetical protein